MQVHHQLHQLPKFKNAVVTIGTFDGVHSGHRIIIDRLVQTARQQQGESVIITFHPHPRQIVGKSSTPILLLNTFEEKVELIGSLGVNHLVVVPFTEAFANQSAADYVAKFLVALFRPSTIIIGYDHRFGKNRSGNYALLEALQEKFGYALQEISEKLLYDIAISSTRIRSSLLQTQVANANELLGYDYFFSGKIVEGNKLGRTIGFATANLQIPDKNKLIPGNGVYAVRVRLLQQPGAGWLKGMMNIGVRPTVGGTVQTVEVHIFDFDADIYHQSMQVAVHAYLRGEQKFNGLDALKAQLHTDSADAKNALKTF